MFRCPICGTESLETFICKIDSCEFDNEESCSNCSFSCFNCNKIGHKFYCVMECDDCHNTICDECESNLNHCDEERCEDSDSRFCFQCIYKIGTKKYCKSCFERVKEYEDDPGTLAFEEKYVHDCIGEVISCRMENEEGFKRLIQKVQFIQWIDDDSDCFMTVPPQGVPISDALYEYQKLVWYFKQLVINNDGLNIELQPNAIIATLKILKRDIDEKIESLQYLWANNWRIKINNNANKTTADL
jgi:hypothetical protein